MDFLLVVKAIICILSTVIGAYFIVQGTWWNDFPVIIKGLFLSVASLIMLVFIVS